jgi:uncharacterized membrane protein YgcG
MRQIFSSNSSSGNQRSRNQRGLEQKESENREDGLNGIQGYDDEAEDIEAGLPVEEEGDLTVGHGTASNVFLSIFICLVSAGLFMQLRAHFMNYYIAAPAGVLTAVTLYASRVEIFRLVNTINRRIRAIRNFFRQIFLNAINTDNFLNPGNDVARARVVRRLQRSGAHIFAAIVGIAGAGIAGYFFYDLHYYMYEGIFLALAAGLVIDRAIDDMAVVWLNLTRRRFFDNTNNILTNLFYFLGDTIGVRFAWLGNNRTLIRYHIQRYRSVYSRPRNHREAIRRGQLQSEGNLQASIILFALAGGVTLIFFPINIAAIAGGVIFTVNYAVAEVYLHNTFMNLDHVALGRRRAEANCAAAGDNVDDGDDIILPAHYSPTMAGDRLAEIAVLVREISVRSLVAAVFAPAVYFLPPPANGIAGGTIGLDIAEGINGVRVANRAFRRRVPPERVGAIIGRSRLVYVYRRSIGLGFLFTLIESAIVLPVVFTYTTGGPYVASHAVLITAAAWGVNTGIAYHFRDDLGNALNDLMIFCNFRAPEGMAEDTDTDSDEEQFDGPEIRVNVNNGGLELAMLPSNRQERESKDDENRGLGVYETKDHYGDEEESIQGEDGGIEGKDEEEEEASDEEQKVDNTGRKDNDGDPPPGGNGSSGGGNNPGGGGASGSSGNANGLSQNEQGHREHHESDGSGGGKQSHNGQKGNGRVHGETRRDNDLLMLKPTFLNIDNKKEHLVEAKNYRMLKTDKSDPIDEKVITLGISLGDEQVAGNEKYTSAQHSLTVTSFGISPSY